MFDSAVRKAIGRAALNSARLPLAGRRLAAMRTALALAPAEVAFRSYPRHHPPALYIRRTRRSTNAGRRQYRPGNAAVAVLLVVSVLKEYDQQVAEGTASRPAGP